MQGQQRRHSSPAPQRHWSGCATALGGRVDLLQPLTQQQHWQQRQRQQWKRQPWRSTKPAGALAEPARARSCSTAPRARPAATTARRGPSLSQ
jgi:hypothetical protein